MSEQQETLAVTNPLQAASEVFYKPMAVFKTLAKVNNWSWIPFVIVTIFATIPTYLYYEMIDISWLIEQFAIAGNPDGSPAEIENAKRQMPEGMFKYSYLFIPISLVIVNAIVAAIYTFATKNDESNVQGYTDWYGATWWIAMPMVISSLIACVLLVMQEPGMQVSPSIASPLSLAFIFGVEMTSESFNLLSGLRLDTLWSIALATYCVKAWTSFSLKKSLFIGALPSIILIGISLIIYII